MQLTQEALIFPFRRRTSASAGGRVLVVVQNMAYRFDRRVQNEANALLAAGIGVTIICPKATADEPDLHVLDGVLVRSYPAIPPAVGVLGYVREFIVAWLRTAALSWRCHREEGFDVLQACNPPDTYWALALLWRATGKRFVYDQHDLCPEVFVDRFGRGSLRNRALHRCLLLLERASYLTADHVVSPNESYRELASTRGRVRPERTTVVMSTPDHRLMRRGEPMPGATAGYAYVVAYVGVMGPQDGVDRVLHVARLLRDAGRDDIRFVLMGFGDSRAELEALSVGLGVQDCVTFTGRVDQAELVGWLSAADLGITPDPQTAFNHRSTMNKTLEYMACGLPVVATDLKETRRSAGEAAVYAGSVEEMSRAVADLLDQPGRREQMARVGRSRIEGELSWDRYGPAYVDVVRALLPLPRAQAPARLRSGADRP